MDWKNLEAVVNILSTLKTAVELLSADQSPTSSQIIVLRSEIKSKLLTEANDSTLVRAMKEKMLSKFDDRFPITTLAVAAALLDPRFQNLTEVDNYLLGKGTTKSRFLADQVTEWVKKEDLPSSSSHQQSSSKESSTPTSSRSQADFLSSLAKKHSTASPSAGENRSEIEAECTAFLSNSSALSVLDGNLLGFWSR